MNKIYVLKKKAIIRGPYTTEVLAKRGLKETDMVWFEGLPDWTYPREVEVLKNTIKYYSSKPENITIIDKIFGFLK
jgi:hypothetical protein